MWVCAKGPLSQCCSWNLIRFGMHIYAYLHMSISICICKLNFVCTCVYATSRCVLDVKVIKIVFYQKRTPAFDILFKKQGRWRWAKRGKVRWGEVRRHCGNYNLPSCMRLIKASNDNDDGDDGASSHPVLICIPQARRHCTEDPG